MAKTSHGNKTTGFKKKKKKKTHELILPHPQHKTYMVWTGIYVVECMGHMLGLDYIYHHAIQRDLFVGPSQPAKCCSKGFLL